MRFFLYVAIRKSRDNNNNNTKKRLFKVKCEYHQPSDYASISGNGSEEQPCLQEEILPLPRVQPASEDKAAVCALQTGCGA